MPETTKEKIGIAFYFGLFVFIFLIIFQPFGIDGNSDTVLWMTAGYGLITFFIVAIVSFGIGFMESGFANPDTWTIKHFLILSVVNLILIGIGNWAFDTFFISEKEHEYSLFTFLFITLSVGIFPILLSIHFYENLMTNKNRLIADETTGIILARKQQHTNRLHHFQSSTKNESVSVHSNEIVCIKADGNYCKFFYSKEDLLLKKMLRISLRSVEDELKSEPKIMRCHRSWLVNLEKVQRVTGSARNISLSMENCTFSVPVSRSYAQSVTNALRHL